MGNRITATVNWLLGSMPGRFLPRWIILRCLGLSFFSVFYSLAFQIQGLIGPDGILPAGRYLTLVARQLGGSRLWYAPTVLWLSDSSRALTALWIVGMIASLLLVLNIWPRGMLAICFVAFLSFIAAAQDFSSYQSDGMLLEAGFVSFFVAPRRLRPGWGEQDPPSRAGYFILQWLWFRIYFESGLAKIVGGDPEWRHLTAMDQYYQNGPLPTWIGWYAQQLPHWFHVTTAALTLALECVIVWMFLLPRRWRIVLFWIVTPWEIGIILTANYTFLNYLVMLLGVLLLDDRYLARLLPDRIRSSLVGPHSDTVRQASAESSLQRDDAAVHGAARGESGAPPTPVEDRGAAARVFSPEASAWNDRAPEEAGYKHRLLGALHRGVQGFFFAWIFYTTTVLLIWRFSPGFPLPIAPVRALEPFRIANEFGLFGRMTLARYEVEFQGSNDGEHWDAYPFRYKPQDPREEPKIFAPYQPRFDWNLWFASLESWRQNPWVVETQARLLEGSPAVLSLFAGNPFPGSPPRFVRSVIWQYWFTNWATKRAQGMWWQRELLGLFSPELERQPNGNIVIVPTESGPLFSPAE